MPVGSEGSKSHISFAAALSTGTKHDKEILEKTRGCRNAQEISIETFYNEGNWSKRRIFHLSIIK